VGARRRQCPDPADRAVHELRGDPEGVRAEAILGKRHAAGSSSPADEPALILAELIEADAVLAAWDGTDPSPEDLALRVFLIEDRVAKLEAHVRRLQPRASRA